MSHYSEAEIEMLERRDSRLTITDHRVYRWDNELQGWKPINATPLVYLASPYSHPSEKVKEMRYIQVTKACAWLMTQFAWNVFSPITHSHPLHAIAGVRGDWEFWKRIDTEYIEVSNRLIVFCIPGWRQSVGVTAEIKIAKSLGIRIQYLKFLGPNNYRLDDLC